MTKRRPSWSDCRRWAAALCGLLLLNLPPAAWAAGKKPAARPPAAAHKAKGQSRKPARPARRSGQHSPPPEAAVGPAEIVDPQTGGLRGSASFYGRHFHGRRTSTGERFDSKQFTAASNHFPLGAMVAVRRLDSGLCAIVKINDRMHAGQRRRVIDVSRSVAEYLGMIRAGVVLVRVAPLPAGWRERGLGACSAAFDAGEDPLGGLEPKAPLPSGRGRPSVLPDFGDSPGG